jgi:23S rRNA pseudouridine1911/1915/1917 synthase
MGEILRFTVGDAHRRGRLDTFLVKQQISPSRSQIKRLIEAGSVTVNGTAQKAAYPVKPGDAVEVFLPDAKPPSAHAENIPLGILYEDECIIVVNKPAGLVVHPAAGHRSGTLVNALLYHCSSLSGVGGVLRPGIVHRLDKGTSGVMIAAKDDRAHISLAEQFKARTVSKLYTALVWGTMEKEEGTIVSAVGRHPRNRKKMSVKDGVGSREAVTVWRLIKQFPGLAHIAIDLKTGRTHQIRLHLSSCRHPVVGDPLYGGRRQISHLSRGPLRDHLMGLNRPALHASRLAIRHPYSGEHVEFAAPLPEELEALYNLLEEGC